MRCCRPDLHNFGLTDAIAREGPSQKTSSQAPRRSPAGAQSARGGIQPERPPVAAFRGTPRGEFVRLGPGPGRAFLNGPAQVSASGPAQNGATAPSQIRRPGGLPGRVGAWSGPGRAFADGPPYRSPKPRRVNCPRDCAGCQFRASPKRAFSKPHFSCPLRLGQIVSKSQSRGQGKMLQTP